MIRLRDEESINEFYNNLAALYKDPTTEEHEILELIILSQNYIAEILEAVNKFTLDVTLSSFLVICDLWYKKSGQKIIVHFDNSKQIEYYYDFIDFTRSMVSDKVHVGYGSRTMIFPTQIERLELIDSKEDFSIQLADLIASTIAFMYNNKNFKQEPFVENIRNSKLLRLTNYHTIWPSSAIDPEELNMTDGNGNNILDFLTQKKIEMKWKSKNGD